MGPRAASLTVLALVCGVLSGCRGEFIYSLGETEETGDGDGDIAGDGDGDIAGDGDGDGDIAGDGDGEGDGDGDTPVTNLLANPSFEAWSADQLLVWAVSEATLTASSNTVDGDLAVELSAASYASVSQSVDFGQPLPEGTCLGGGASIRWISGATTAPAFLVTTYFEVMGEDLLGGGLAWTADGQWHESQIAPIELSEPTTSLTLSLGDATSDSHEYAIDAAWLGIVACE